MRLSRLHAVLEEWAARHGPMYRFRIGPNDVVAVSRPDAIAEALRDRPETYRRSPNVAPVLRELGLDGVFSAEGDAWRPQRRLAMQALSHRHLRGFYPTLAEVARRLRRRWAAKADAGAAVDVVDEMKRLTVDVTTALVFGRDVDTIGRDDDAIQRRLGRVFPAVNRRIFAALPTWRWVRTPGDRRVDRALAELREWLAGLVAETRARLAAEPGRAEHPEHFLESMLAARDAAGAPFPDEVVLANALTMLLAGEDTTAYTLAWAVHHLCDAPAAAARLRDEADAAGAAAGPPPDIDHADRLAYAGAVANETMRLRPVAPVSILAAERDVVLGGVAVPRGTWVAVLTRPPARDAAHFADPDAFRPERWLGAPPADGAHEPAAHLPFGSGPRICPGRSLALLEMKAVLAMLYGAFDVERAAGGPAVREEFAFTMHPVGLRVRLRRRAGRRLRARFRAAAPCRCTTPAARCGARRPRRARPRTPPDPPHGTRFRPPRPRPARPP
jgi:cytochrome P450